MRTKAAYWVHPEDYDWYERERRTTDVFEVTEETHSSILGPDGAPIPYQSKKLGHVGFVKLGERS